jgi:1-acyl-sn-glycerol-3-phosphate acyltransferase
MSAQAEIERTKTLLLQTFESFLAERDEAQIAGFRTAIQALLDRTPEGELLNVVKRVATTGDDWGYFPPEPFARHVHRAMADTMLTPDSGVRNAERLEAVRGRSLVLLPNHISYSDANLLEILLWRAGLGDVSERMTVVAGPKVYSDSLRKFLSLCFGTIKTAQSKSLATGEAVMSAREVAAIARQTIELAFERMSSGDALLVFAEGTRSRAATMQPLLAAVSRYLEREGSVLVPIGITGTETLIGVDDNQLHPTCVVAHIGEPIEAAELKRRANGKRNEMTALIGRAIAAALPEKYRGVYA